LSVEPDRNAAEMMRRSITQQFAEMLGHVACARRGAVDLTAQGLQFGHEVHQRTRKQGFRQIVGTACHVAPPRRREL